MRLLSWNVNGLRSVLRKGFLAFARRHAPDVLCLQETRCPPMELGLDGYLAYWNPASRPGYSGTAILTKRKPLAVRAGMGRPFLDDEGRVLTAEFEDFHLVNVYVPNSRRDLSRLPYRVKQWDVAFLRFLKRLERRKPVVFCGDMNVAHKEIDLTHPKANVRNHGFTPEERAGFDRLVAAGFVDSFREFEAGGGHYTWWSRLNRCRERNVGWRIDYFCLSRALRPRLERAFILRDVLGSDHCPVGIDII